jgi:RNA polymerase sigma-70 factor (ECF subfamily)
MSFEPTPGEHSTVELLERVRSGQDDALEALYLRYLAPLRRWARGRLPGWARDAMETDDVVQETLLQTLGHLGSFESRHTGAFHAYLRRAVRNRIFDEMRRVGRRPVSGNPPTRQPDPRPSPLEEAIGRETLDRYESALERLSRADREAVIARVELGLAYREVARALDKPSADAARMAVSRALVRLAREMARGP